MSLNEAEGIIDRLKMQQHPEGGWYAETYRSEIEVDVDQGKRSLATVIYFMLKSGELSVFHRLKSDEFWYYHQGSTMRIDILLENGSHEVKYLGKAGEGDALPQVLLPAGCWFAAKCEIGNSYGLVSCSVHPGFDFLDFEMAEKYKLLNLYPQHSKVIDLYFEE